MKLRLFSSIFMCVSAAACVAQTGPHNFSVKDDIAMTRFSDPSDQQENFDRNRVKYSPDGKHVAVVTTRGLFESDQIESTLSVFPLDKVAAFLRHQQDGPPQRRVLAVVTERPSGENEDAESPMIEEVRWAVDSKSLYFKAANALGAMHLEEVSVDGAQRRRLTPLDYSVDRYDVENGTVAYTAAKVGQKLPQPGTQLNRDAFDETGASLRNILGLGLINPENFVLGEVQSGDSNDRVHEVKGYSDMDISVLLFRYPFRLSPDGRFLITTVPLLKIPEEWKRYDPEIGFEHSRLDPASQDLTKPNNSLRPREYVLIELATGKTAPLIVGPNATSLSYASDQNVAAWAPDGRRVLVSNVFLPLVPGQAHIRPCRVATVDRPAMTVRCLFFRDSTPPSAMSRIDTARFDPGAVRIRVRLRSTASGFFNQEYVLRDNVWVQDPGAEQKKDDLDSDGLQGPEASIFIKQSLNERPTLWASDAEGKIRSRQIWDPNPQLRDVRFGDISVYRWKDANGRDWVGGLIRPVGYIAGKRYPLILQLYMFRQNEFLTDGTEPTAFAARELASKGFVVLQIQKKASTFTEADPQIHLEAYRSAVQSLSEAGLIDPAKVGVIGYSMTCWYAENALVKDPHLFAAATIADGFDYNYMTYMMFGPGPPLLVEQANRVRGGGPFGASKQEWFKDALGFHLDQVETPVRLEAHTAASILGEWELYASLYLQHKPVDLIYLPEASHVLQRPLERYQSQQGDIDWMRFWLEGYEDPDPGKQEQYRRWEAMKLASH